MWILESPLKRPSGSSRRRQDRRPRAARRLHRRCRAGVAPALPAGRRPTIRLEVVDLASTNGTFVNGKRVERGAR